MAISDFKLPDHVTALYLAFDPGDTTGWAIWDQDGDFLYMGQIAMEDLPFWWERNITVAVRVVIVEEYILFGKRAKQQTGSRMKASQAIGMIKAMASRGSAQVIEQKSNIKPIAIRMSQISMPGNHSESHQYDAYLHGYYYLVGQGIILTQLELEKKAERERRASTQEE